MRVTVIQNANCHQYKLHVDMSGARCTEPISIDLLLENGSVQMKQNSADPVMRTRFFILLCGLPAVDLLNSCAVVLAIVYKIQLSVLQSTSTTFTSLSVSKTDQGSLYQILGLLKPFFFRKPVSGLSKPV